jgi:hypothetical protein
MTQNKNFVMAVNHKYFTNSLLQILNLVEEKSNNIIADMIENYEKGAQSEPDYTKTKKYKAHITLQQTCKTIKNGFSQYSEHYDHGKVIKKIYKVLTQNLDKFFPEQDNSLFQVKNEKNELVTIIPGLDINLVLKQKFMSEENMKFLWGNLYMMYVSSASMILTLNSESKKTEKVKELLPQMRVKIVEMGVTQDNPFVGLNVETGEYDVETMFTNSDIPQQDLSGMSTEDMLKMSGINKLFDMKELTKQLEELDDATIEKSAKDITKIIGADGDSDIGKICDTLVKNAVSELKNSKDGNIDIFGIARTVAQNVGKNMKKEDFEKTANHFNNFMANSQENFKNMKDENGNPISENLLNSLNIPLQMAKMMGK